MGKSPYEWPIRHASFHDPAGNTVIGSAKFRNTRFHTFPDPPEIAAELIGQIYGDAPGTYMK
jgi:hypothetical protein